MLHADTGSSAETPANVAEEPILPSVLIADDAAFMRMMIRNILSEAGHEIVGEAQDGEDAVGKFRELRPDLTTLDVTMTGIDGLAALRAIREEDPDARVVMCSALGQRSVVVESFESGARDFIVKPFQPDRVLSAVEKALA